MANAGAVTTESAERRQAEEQTVILDPRGRHLRVDITG